MGHFAKDCPNLDVAKDGAVVPDVLNKPQGLPILSVPTRGPDALDRPTSAPTMVKLEDSTEDTRSAEAPPVHDAVKPSAKPPPLSSVIAESGARGRDPRNISTAHGAAQSEVHPPTPPSARSRAAKLEVDSAVIVSFKHKDGAYRDVDAVVKALRKKRKKTVRVQLLMDTLDPPEWVESSKVSPMPSAERLPHWLHIGCKLGARDANYDRDHAASCAGAGASACASDDGTQHEVWHPASLEKAHHGVQPGFKGLLLHVRYADPSRKSQWLRFAEVCEPNADLEQRRKQLDASPVRRSPSGTATTPQQEWLSALRSANLEAVKALIEKGQVSLDERLSDCLLYTSPSPRDS